MWLNCSEISTKNAITIAISTKQKSTCSCSTMIHKRWGWKKSSEWTSLEMRAASMILAWIGCEKVQPGFVQDQHQCSFLGTRHCSFMFISSIQTIQTSFNVHYFYVTHHCFLPFISIHFFAEREFIFLFWNRPPCLKIFHDEKINCPPHLPRSLTRCGRALSVIKHKAVPCKIPWDSLYARLSTYHCMEAARQWVGTGEQIVVHLCCDRWAWKGMDPHCYFSMIKTIINKSIVDHTYQDHSQDVVKNYHQGSNTKLFPVKLHQIVSTPEYQHIIAWKPHGHAWHW